MSAKDELQEAIETVKSTYDDLDDPCENVARNGVMCLDAVVRELDLQERGEKRTKDLVDESRAADVLEEETDEGEADEEQ